MKFQYIFLPVCMAFVLLFQSCTKIDEPYAIIKNVNIKDTTMNWDGISMIRKILLEDYTGHKCVNCPEAAAKAHSLEQQYGEQLLVMAVHAGFYAKPDKTGEYALDLRTPTGDVWNGEFGFTSYPNGMVNRKSYEGSRVVDPGKWGTVVGLLSGTAPDFQMKIENRYNPETRGLVTTIYNRFLGSMTGEYTLTVCILEDSIIGAQKNNNPEVGAVPDIHDYVFNEVFRESLNGDYGELLTATPDPDLTYMGRYQVTLNTAYTAKNCHVMAFVSNKTTREILQAERMKIIP